MRRLVISQFISLDGVVEDPGGSEKTAAGGWAFQFDRGPEGDKFKLDELIKAEAMLLGRTTYEGFAAAWPSRKDEVGFADKINNMPKYVVSRSLERADWTNSSIIRDVVPAVSELKQGTGGELLVNGSVSLARTLMEHGLVDEYRLMVYPVVLGTGKRLFTEGAPMTRLRLSASQPAGECLILTYEPAEVAVAEGTA
jgi:dihydrofolate reductase